MELYLLTHIIVEVAKALGGSRYASVKNCKGMTQLPKETQKNLDTNKNTNKSKTSNKHAKHKPRLNMHTHKKNTRPNRAVWSW